MKRLIDAIIAKWFCLHDWELIREVEVSDYTETPKRRLYGISHYKCNKCGKFKKIRSS